MKSILHLKFFLLIFCLTGIPHLRSEAALKDAFQESLNLSQNIEIYRLKKERNDAGVDALSAKLYPALKLIGNARYGNNTYQSREGLDRVDTNLALNLTHPLFQGGAEYPLYQLKILLPEKNKLELTDDIKNYFIQFATSYFQTASVIEEEEKQLKQIENVSKRVQLLESRVKIGQDKRSDLYLLKAQLLRLKADHSEIRSRVEQSIKSFYTLSSLEEKDDQYFQDKKDPLELVLSSELDLRSQSEYLFSQQSYQAAYYESLIAKSAYFPNINVSANYYLDQYRTSRDDWDLGLTLTMNLYDFGETASSASQAKLNALIADKTRQLKERELGLEWSELLTKFKYKKEQYQHLKEALDFSKRSYEDQLKDLSRGLVNQIDVIRALDDIINLEKVVIKSAHDLKLFYFQAEAFRNNLAGVLP